MQKNSYDPFGAELRRFAENIDRREFRSVVSGFGYASVRPRTLTAAVAPAPILPPVLHRVQEARVIARLDLRRPQAPSPFNNTSASHIPKLDTAPIVPRATESFNIPPIARPKRSLSSLSVVGTMSRWAAGHLIDLLVVSMSFAVAVIIGGISFAPRHAAGFAPTILQWTPVQLLLQLKLPYLVIMIYGLFFIYRGFLRLAAGSTIGDGLVKGRI